MDEITSEFKDFAKLEDIGLTYNPEDLKILIESIDNMDKGAVFVVEKDKKVIGSIIAVVIPWFLDASIQFVQIIGTLVSVHSRGTGAGDCLLDAVSDWGKTFGASRILGASLQINPDINLNNWYKKRGFKIFESYYMKEV